MELTLRMFLLLYGGIGGWLGIAFAIYLNRIRVQPAHPAAVLSVFAMGFTMLTGTALLADILHVYHPAIPAVLLFIAYTLLLLGELVVLAAHVRPAVFGDLRAFVGDDPRFAHYYQRLDAADRDRVEHPERYTERYRDVTADHDEASDRERNGNGNGNGNGHGGD